MSRLKLPDLSQVLLCFAQNELEAFVAYTSVG
jgi:hypothetical protein